MNFKNIPELQLEYGYFIVMGMMAIACAALFWPIPGASDGCKPDRQTIAE